MSQVIEKKFKDGEFHYKDTWKHANKVDKALSKLDKEDVYLDEFVMVLNSMIKRSEHRTSEFIFNETEGDI